MWIADGWKDYEVLDTSGGEKLERWGDYLLVRPDPQVIWNTKKENPGWKKKNGHYHRSSKGGGEWEFFHLPEQWEINYKDLTFRLKPFSFKHTGLFPEQATNWDWFGDLIRRANRPIKVLNLFAYTEAQRSQRPQQAQASHMSMHPKAWSTGQKRTLPCPAFRTSRSAGLWMTAPNLSSARSAEATTTTRSSWTRRPTEEDQRARSGKSRSRFIRSSSSARSS